MIHSSPMPPPGRDTCNWILLNLNSLTPTWVYKPGKGCNSEGWFPGLTFHIQKDLFFTTSFVVNAIPAQGS